MYLPRPAKKFRLSSALLPLAILIMVSLATSQACSQNLDVPYVPTPQAVVERMLDVANVQPCDYVIDLGSGDGRIIIAAAKRGASGHGIDLDPRRIAEARKNAQRAGVNSQIMFKQENIFDTDFSKATVLTMYLLPTVNKKLRPELLDKLEPGTRLVSHSFHMGEWEPDRELTVSDAGGTNHEIYYWIIPAKATGRWQWSADGKTFMMDVDQTYQDISVSLSDGKGNTYHISKALLQGKRISVRAVNGNHSYILNGQIKGNKIMGIMQSHNGAEKSFSSWEANKQ